MSALQIVSLAIAAGFILSAFHRAFASPEARADKTGQPMYTEDEYREQ